MAKKNIIQYKNAAQIEKIRESGKYLTELLHELYDMCVPWATTRDLELHADAYIRKHNLRGAFKWYGWFPTNLCASNNDCVVHGIPDTTPLVAWDLLKIDCGIDLGGYISDAAFSIVIWWDATNPDAASLVHTSKKALDKWLKAIKIWNTGKQYGRTVEQIVKADWYSVVKHLTGHGVWFDVHENPSIYNRPQNGMKKWMFQPGMVLAIEPIIAQYSEDYIEHKNIPHNLYTTWWDLWAQWEYTIALTVSGLEILAGIQENPRMN